MMKKIVSKIFLFLFVFAIGMNVCNAAGLSFNNHLVKFDGFDKPGKPGQQEEKPESGAGDDTKDKENTENRGYKEGNNRYQYHFKKTIKTKTNISMNAYNLEGESVIPKTTKIDPKNYTFKAGTWVGISVMESHRADWRVYDITYEEVYKKYTCTYKREYSYWANATQKATTASWCSSSGERKKPGTFTPDSDTSNSSLGTCKYEWKKYGTYEDEFNKDVKYYESYDCPEKLPTDNRYKLVDEKSEDITKPITSGAVVDTMKQLAINEVYTEAKSKVNWSSGLVKYIKNTNMPKEEKDYQYNIIDLSTENKNLAEDIKTSETSGYVSKTFDFLEKKICMDVKTSFVTYGRDCNKNEIRIKNGSIYDKYLGETVNFWHYFIPLDAKSDSKFSLDVVKNEKKKFEVAECLSFMTDDEYKDNYQEFITPIGKNEKDGFLGDYNKFSTDEAKQTYSLDYKKLIAGEGCNISTKIYFPIEQKFYNEVKKASKITFDGFNFYYKPINVDGATKDNQRSIVFQNGLKTPSLWEDWYKAQTDNKATTEEKSPDLTKSFTKEPTYVASNIKASHIRNYNKNNNYTSWDKMNIDGKSQFINTQGMIFRGEPGEVYKLGCGPANSDKKSILYIKGCDVKS